MAAITAQAAMESTQTGRRTADRGLAARRRPVAGGRRLMTHCTARPPSTKE